MSDPKDPAGLEGALDLGLRRPGFEKKTLSGETAVIRKRVEKYGHPVETAEFLPNAEAERKDAELALQPSLVWDLTKTKDLAKNARM
ncbi:MAG: hypothetical protein ACYCZK_00585 [Microbacteriaceae bacterium]